LLASLVLVVVPDTKDAVDEAGDAVGIKGKLKLGLGARGVCSLFLSSASSASPSCRRSMVSVSASVASVVGDPSSCLTRDSSLP
jgi:hypothetical protein